ncbi:MAG TPA: hypothetical protein VJC18_07865, partial [bacterium]|nr:hypothetical protein [bacterium]
SPSLSPQGGIPFAGQKGGAVPSCCLLRNKISKRKAFFTHFYVAHPSGLGYLSVNDACGLSG